MINWLFTALLPLTLLLGLILLLRQPLRRATDAATVYRLWLLIPLALIFYTLPLPWQHISELNNANIQTYLVKPTQNINQQLSFDGLFLFWFIGPLLLSAYWLLTHYQYHQALKMGKPPNTAAINELGNRMPGNLRLAQSSHIHSPLLIGLIKQTLVIPEDFETLYSKQQQQLIIAHEVCHFSHYHMWANQLALLLVALFWFHPLAWRAYRCFRQDQEHSCDQTVLAHEQTQSKIQYCKALVLAAENSPPTAFTLINFKHDGEQNFMFNRIEEIKTMSKTHSANLAVIALLSTSLLAGVSYAGNHLQHAASAGQAAQDGQPVYRIEPDYPAEAAQQGIEGSVVLQFDIKPDGSVVNVAVVDGKPAGVFDQTAITALTQWRYKETGKPMTDLLVQLDFVLGNSNALAESFGENVERIKVER